MTTMTKIQLLLRAWWPSWIATLICSGITGYLLWGVGWDLWPFLVGGAAVFGFFLALILRLPCMLLE